MLWIHPILQLLAFLASLYVLYLGAIRFAAAHLGKKQPFNWKRHVQAGKVVMIVWLLAWLIGLAMAHYSWHSVFITGLHYQVALVLVPFTLFGLISGQVMDKVKKRRTTLPLAHAINNALVVILVVVQVVSGIGVLRDYVLP